MQSETANSKSQIARVAVIGAGTMGHGIAQVAAMAGYETRLTDAHPETLAAACDRIQTNLAGAVARGKMTQAQLEAATATLVPVTDLQTAIHEADLVIEAVVEELAIKQALFQQDRKSTRLNSSHTVISYAVFCLKKKKKKQQQQKTPVKYKTQNTKNV